MSSNEERIADRVTRRLRISQEDTKHYHAAYHRLIESGLSPDDLNSLCPLIFAPEDCDMDALQNDLTEVAFSGLLINLYGE